MSPAAHSHERREQDGGVGLLIVDATVAFTSESSPLACPMDGALAAIRALLNTARRNDAPVAFTRVAYGDDISPGAELFRRKVPALTALRDGAPVAEIDRRVAPLPTERVVVKELASAFHGTGLAQWVSDNQIHTLVVTGASTSGCVRATVVDALQLGIHVVVPREAVGDRDGDSHEASLRDIAWRYGDVVGLDEAQSLLQGRG